jgi:hypothetical protein
MTYTAWQVLAAHGCQKGDCAAHYFTENRCEPVAWAGSMLAKLITRTGGQLLGHGVPPGCDHAWIRALHGELASRHTRTCAVQMHQVLPLSPLPAPGGRDSWSMACVSHVPATSACARANVTSTGAKLMLADTGVDAAVLEAAAALPGVRPLPMPPPLYRAQALQAPIAFTATQRLARTSLAVA